MPTATAAAAARSTARAYGQAVRGSVRRGMRASPPDSGTGCSRDFGEPALLEGGSPADAATATERSTRAAVLTRGTLDQARGNTDSPPKVAAMGVPAPAPTTRPHHLPLPRRDPVHPPARQLEHILTQPLGGGLPGGGGAPRPGLLGRGDAHQRERVTGLAQHEDGARDVVAQGHGVPRERLRLEAREPLQQLLDRRG